VAIGGAVDVEGTLTVGGTIKVKAGNMDLVQEINTLKSQVQALTATVNDLIKKK
jgi:hypothetical protein